MTERKSDMTDFIIIAIVFIILTVSICYIIKEKKRGVKCIGCPMGGTCSGKRHNDGVCTGNCQES